MSFRITGLDPAAFRPLFDLDDASLAARNMRRVMADAPHAAPCRVSLEDAEPGEELILLNYEHQPMDSPFRSTGPIFVRKAAVAPWDAVDEIPPVVARRPISARAYDRDGMMLEGELVDGSDVAPLIEKWFENPAVEEVHLHFAKRGCFGAVARRA